MTEKLIECDCGWTCRGVDEHLIAECSAHAREVHGMDLTPEQILAVAVPVDEADAPGATPNARLNALPNENSLL